MIVRFNKNKQKLEVNCVGVFNSDFFSLDEIVKRQDEIYQLISNRNLPETLSELNTLYNTLEEMRVKLITSMLF